jgi:O-antigen ligase
MLYNGRSQGVATGLFANRNHHALLMAILFPALAVWAKLPSSDQRQQRVRGWIALGFALLLIPLIVITGSRAGLLLAMLGIGAGWHLYSSPLRSITPRANATSNRYVLLIGGAALALLIAMAMSSRAESLSRLFGQEQDLSRLQIWGPTLPMVWRYFPTGSGVGSFVEVFQLGQPDSSLALTFANHAHNDWLEVALTTGAPGIFLLGVAVTGFVRTARKGFSRADRKDEETTFARLGLVIVAMLGLASVVDYPLRTPAFSSVLVVAAVWASFAWGTRSPAAQSPRESNFDDASR